MRDRTRLRLLAQAKSHRATPEDLREAGKRVKEIEQEFRQLELSSEAKHGEERSERYSRLLRLREMREDFQTSRPLEMPKQPNSYLLAIVMVVASFMLCASCVLGGVLGLQLVHQKPDPMAAANGFWYDMEHQTYADLQSTYLSPTLRVQYESQFVSLANTSDQDFGIITDATLTKQSGDMQSTAILTYAVTRANHVSYTTTLTLTLHGGSWGVDDLGATIDPTKAGIPAPATPTPTSTPQSAPADTTTPGASN